MAKEVFVQSLRQATTLASSRSSQRVIIRTILLLCTASTQVAVAVLCYIYFYHGFLPDQVTTVPAHLQYGYGPHPFALAPLRNLREQQPYDICVSLTLPPSPVNQAKGNFMVTLHLLYSSDDRPFCASDSPSKKRFLETAEILDTFRRTALMPYIDPTIALVCRVLLLPLNILRGVEERVVLTRSMAEQSLLDHSGKLPNMMLLEVEAGHSLQVHSASITVTAQLRGLRWIMHHHWMASFVVLTLTFWSIEVLSTFLVWLALSHFFGSQYGILQMLSDVRWWSSSSVPPEIQRESENGSGSDVPMKEEDTDYDAEEKPDIQLVSKDDVEDNCGKAR